MGGKDDVRRAEYFESLLNIRHDKESELSYVGRNKVQNNKRKEVLYCKKEEMFKR